MKDRSDKYALWVPRIGERAWRLRVWARRVILVGASALILLVALAAVIHTNAAWGSALSVGLVSVCLGASAVSGLLVVRTRREVCRFVGAPMQAARGLRPPNRFSSRDPLFKPELFDAWREQWVSAEQGHQAVPLPPRVPPDRSATNDAWFAAGSFVASTVLAVVVSVEGTHRHATWLAFLGAASVALSALMLVLVLRRQRQDQPGHSEMSRRWWTRRGRWLVGSASMPVWIALLIASNLKAR